MTKDEIVEVLTQNGYEKHSVFQFYYVPKKNLGYYFYPDINNTIVGKIKWNNIALNEFKTVSSKTFNPHTYNLVTVLDLKIRSKYLNQIALKKQLEKRKQQNKEPVITPQQPEEN
jgi:hypothetical protein